MLIKGWGWLLFHPMRNSLLFLLLYNAAFLLAVNLSMADTMVSSLNVTFNLVYMLNCH